MSAPFRIKKPVPPVKGEPAEPGDDYAKRLLKMIPAEVVAGYLAGTGVIEGRPQEWLLGWTIFCFGATIVVRAWGTADPQANKGPDWLHVFVSAVAFAIWVYAIGGVFATYGLYDGGLATLMMIAWTLIWPWAYKGPDSP